MRALLYALLIATPLFPADNSISSAEAQDGWILLFDGESTFGLKQEGNTNWKFANGMISFDGGDSGTIRTLAAFSDYVLKLEFRSSGDPNASVFLRISGDGKPQDTGYELRLGDTDPKWPAGSVTKVFEGNGRFAANQWHRLEAELNGDKLLVKIDDHENGGSDPKSKAGFISLAGNRGAPVDFRDIKLKPIGRTLFNGIDLDGWKRVNEAVPEAKPGGGVIKEITKVLKPPPHKPKEALWSPVDGAIHGTKGPGQLESESAYDDFVLQFDVRINNRGHHAKAAVLLRGDAGKLGSGYELPIDNEGSTGGIAGVKPTRPQPLTNNEFVTETIAVRGRQFDIWVNGHLVNDYHDPRTLGKSPKKEARVAGGPIAFLAPDAESNLDFKNIKIAALPKTPGGHPGVVVSAAPPTLPAVASTPAPSMSPSVPAPSTPPAPPAPVIIQNPNQAKDDAKQQQVKKLTQEALRASDPAEQARLWESILAIDPTNVVASQRYEAAQQRLDQAKTLHQQTAEEHARQSREETQRTEQYNEAIKAGEAAFFAGNLTGAQSQLLIAQKITPNDPRVQNLNRRVGTAMRARQRITWLATGGGLIVLAGGLGLLIVALGKKVPYLEVVHGSDTGKRFGLEQEVVRIGAITQVGDAKNDIVLADANRMISRFHCEIHRRQNKLFLVDMNSANGTFLDKRSIAPGRFVRLKKGSQVGLGGSCTLRVGFEKKKKV